MQKAGSHANEFLSNIGYATIEEATWECPDCGIVAPKQLTFNGRYSRTKKCRCMLAEEQRQVDEEQRKEQERRCYSSWLSVSPDTKALYDSSLTQRTFMNFPATTTEQQNALIAAQLFAAELQGNFTLCGKTGTGKTHLLAAIANEVRQRGISCRFTTSTRFFLALQKAMANDEDYTLIIDRAIKTPLLIIDDVDKAKVSDFRGETYFEIIDSRINRGLPTAISTNRVEDLEQFVGSAVASRLAIGRIAVAMNGADYRVSKEE